MKRVIIFLVIGIVFLSLFIPLSCKPTPPLTPTPAPTPKPTPITMRIIHAYPEVTQHGRNMLKFKELTEKYTEGRIKVEIFPAASVCPIDKEIPTVLAGGAEASYNIGGIVETIDPAEAIWTIPFLFRTAPGDVRHIRKAFIGSKIEKILRERQMKKGLYRLGNVCTVDGFMICANNVRPIKKAEDIKGLKLRHPGGMLGHIYWKSLGASPIVIRGAEVPVALETGVIDGLTTVPLHYHDARWHTKYLTLPYWCTYSLPFLVNLSWWNKLPADIRDIIEKKVMPELHEYAFSSVERLTIKALEEMSKPPFNVQIYVMPEEEIQRLKEVTQPPAIEKYKEAVGAALADELIEEARKLAPEKVESKWPPK